MKGILSAAIIAAAALSGNCQNAETFTIEGSEGKLYTELQKPESEKGKMPLVIICHGFTGNCKQGLLTNIANDLEADGIASIRFDFNGHGRSEGRFQDMTVLNEIEDLKKVIAWAQAQPWVESISLVGHSQGGVVVGMVAGELGDKVIKNLVLMAPAAVLRDDALRGSTMGAHYDPWNLKEDYVQLPMGGHKLGRKYIETALSLPIYETSLKYTGPVLVIHGTHDRIVPYTYGERYHQGYKNSSIKLVPGEDHSFSGNIAGAAKEAADWLDSQLKAGK